MSSVAENQADIGDREAAQQTIAKALDAARSVEDAFYRVKAIHAVAESQALIGDVEGALDTAQSLDSAAGRALAMRVVATSIANAIRGKSAKE